jgi:hypothetical protein
MSVHGYHYYGRPCFLHFEGKKKLDTAPSAKRLYVSAKIWANIILITPSISLHLTCLLDIRNSVGTSNIQYTIKHPIWHRCVFLCKLRISVLLNHNQALYIKLEVKRAICLYSFLWDITINICAYCAFIRKYKCIFRFYLLVNFLYIEVDDGPDGRKHVAYIKINSLFGGIWMFNYGT